MNPVLDWLTTHWFGCLLLAFALALGVALLFRGRRGHWSLSLRMGAGGLALLGLSGLFLPPEVAVWVCAGAGAVLLLMCLVLGLTGYWSSLLAWVVAAVLCVGVGGWTVGATGELLTEGWKVARDIEFLS